MLGHGWHFGGMDKDPMEGGRGVLKLDLSISSLHISLLRVSVLAKNVEYTTRLCTCNFDFGGTQVKILSTSELHT